DLEDAVFTGANLAYANFRRANLTRAILKGAKLGSVNLREAKAILGADLSEVKLDNDNFKRSSSLGIGLTSYKDVNFQSADLRSLSSSVKAMLREQGANIDKAILYNRPRPRYRQKTYLEVAGSMTPFIPNQYVRVDDPYGHTYYTDPTRRDDE